MPAQVFEYSDGIQSSTTGDVLGIWSPLPSAPVRAIAFATPGETPAEVPVWRANLPANPELAGAALADAEAGLDRSRAALDAAETRIDALVEQRTAPVSFGVRAAQPPLDLPEQELLRLLDEAERGRPDVSFDTRGIVPSGWEQAVDEFRDFAGRVGQIMTHYAWIETLMEGQLLVRTTVDWTGDMQTACQAELDPAQMALHGRTLATALETRKLMLRSMIVVAAGASKLTLLLTSPGGAILALPAALKFINQIRAEMEKYQLMTEAIENGK